MDQPVWCSSTAIPASVYSAAEPPPGLLGDPGQRPAPIRIPARRRPGIQDLFQLGHLGGSELALRAADALGRQRLLAPGRQRPPLPVRRHPRDPEMLRDLPVTSPGLDQPGRLQPDLLPASPLRCRVRAHDTLDTLFSGDA